MEMNGAEEERDSGFGLRFRLLLGYHDLTLRDVSEVTGAAISTVGTWRNGKIPSSPQIIEEIAKLFKVTSAYLVYGVTQNRKEIPIDKGICEIENCIAQKFHEDALTIHSSQNQRQKIEHYIALYLDEAEKFEGGLDHAWLQLLKEFPLKWFSYFEDYINQKQFSE